MLFIGLGIITPSEVAAAQPYYYPTSPAPAPHPAPYMQAPPPRPVPYGQYQYQYRAPRNWYGQRRSVPNIYEAGRIMGLYYQGRDVRIGPVIERDIFYQADVRDRNGVLVDKVIIDKRTGRMRSIY